MLVTPIYCDLGLLEMHYICMIIKHTFVSQMELNPKFLSHIPIA